MLTTSLIKESKLQEYYTISINSKVLHVIIEKGQEGPVFTIEDHGVFLTEAERASILEELRLLSIGFSSRRLFGNYTPKGINPGKDVDSRGAANRYNKRFS